MRTILISIFDGIVSRNLLRTDVFRTLKEGGHQIVLVIPAGRLEFYMAECGAPNVVIVPTPQHPYSRGELFLRMIALSSIPTHAMKIMQVDRYWKKRKYFLFFMARLCSFAGRFRVWHCFLRMIDRRIASDVDVSPILNAHPPDLIFLGDMISRLDIALYKAAKQRGIRTVGMIKSWDNLTTKTFFRIWPDRLVVHSEIVAREACELYGYPKEKIFISGVPQFDIHTKRELLISRDEFFNKIGADPQKKLILYAAAGDWMNQTDAEVLRAISRWITEGNAVIPVQVLVRLHPKYASEAETLKGLPHLIVDRPGTYVSGTLVSVEFTNDDVRHLANSLAHADVTINTASTMSIDAACYDKPVILIGFDGVQHFSYFDSVRRYYRREHYRPIVESGGATLVTNFDEFFSVINRYLADPSLDAAGRARLRHEQGFDARGKSGERLANFLIEMLITADAPSGNSV